MAQGRMLERLQRGELALGALQLGVGAELIETLGYAGYDYVIIDQMLTPVDWHDTAHMVRAAEVAGMTSIVRTLANPWVGAADTRIMADAMRALAVGAGGVMVSISTREQAEQLVAVGGDWHRKVHVIPFSASEFAGFEASAREATVMMPVLEDAHSLENAEAILSVPGLRVAMIGITDMTKEMGLPLQYEHPEVWAMVDRIVALGRKYGVYIGGNTGYEAKSLQQQVGRVRNLAAHGVNFVQTQTLQWLLQLAAMSVTRGARGGSA